VIDPSSTDGLLNKAFQLASFIVGERNSALQIVTGALAKLEVTAATQGKRLYYRPKGRLWSHRSESNHFRNNISFNEPHLLQRLIYLEAEPYEIAQEQAKGSVALAEEDLVIHFIKHLTKKTVKRNSFYVTLGLSRLLYSYTTAETMDIYNAVIQDPERVKDDYYYRSRKGVLMQELKQRFGDLINICRGPRGEERFEADENQGRFVELVRECLSFFTPWHTPCLVPAGIDPITDGIPSFSYQGHNDEDKLEVNRIHAVLHPECFQRLTADLGFAAPNTRLEIPRFFHANDMNGNGSNSGRRNPPKLNEQELTSIKGQLDDNATRRKAARAGVLRIMVDGVERARIDLNNTRNAQVPLDEDAELIEVRSHDNSGEEVLLATHLLDHEGPEDRVPPADASIILEGGQKISIQVSPASWENNAAVEITYAETDSLRAASLLFRQLAQSLSDGVSRSGWKDRRVFVAAIVVVFAISLAVLMKYVRRDSSLATEPNQTAATPQNSQAKDESQATKAATDNGATSAAGEINLTKTSNPPPQIPQTRQQRQNIGPSPKSESTARNSEERNSDTASVPGTVTETETRSLAARPAGVPLSAVKRVYVEAVGDETLSQSLGPMLAEQLRASNRIILVHNRNQADALLKVTVKKSISGRLEKTDALVELINARGNVIWSNSRGNYQGSPGDISANIVSDLLTAVKNSKQRK
jgi:hypothetical protein